LGAVLNSSLLPLPGISNVFLTFTPIPFDYFPRALIVLEPPLYININYENEFLTLALSEAEILIKGLL
jgi:hypothetical protein